MPTPTLAQLDPKQAAQQLLEEQSDATWLASFAAELDRRLATDQLTRVMTLWKLSRSELGRLFGVSRQGVTKWLDEGVPAERVQQVADLGAMSDLLMRYLKRDRIAAVVRRPAANLGDVSLLDLVAQGHSREALAATRQMFDFGDAHA